MTEQDKQEVEEELQMEYAYDWFLDDNPDVLERVARGELRSEQRGEQRGELRGLQRSTMTIVKSRFPLLAAQAQPRIERIQDTDEIEQLLIQLTSATIEAEAYRILRIQAREQL